MRAQHTHRGHCQACGAVQAAQIHNGAIAKHGYEVKGGYFSGTCSGSLQKPLELDRSYTDSVIASCERNAVAADTLAAELAAGIVNPLRVSLGSKYEPKARNGKGGYVEQWAAWASDVPTDYQRKAQRERDIRESIARGEFMRGHAKRLRELAARVHGQPLRLREKIERTEVKVGTKFTANGHEYEVTRVNVRGGMGMRAIYTGVKQVATGREFKMSTAAVRGHIERARNA